MGITADSRYLGCESKDNGLVGSCGTRGSGILVLLNSRDLWVDGSLVTADTDNTNTGSVTLKSLVRESVDHSTDVLCSFGVGEGLVSDGLVKTVGVGGGSQCVARDDGSVSEKTKDRVTELGGVAESQIYTDTVEESVVRVFLGNLTAAEAISWDELVPSLWDRNSLSQAQNRDKNGCCFVFHDGGREKND